jgi:large subunit ribosomal protein L15
VPDGLDLSSLQPAQKRPSRKRVGRGLGSGKGRYSGRGLKGQKSRAGSAKMRPGFEGGQMPVYMRLGKQRGPTSKDAMPIGPFRTSTYAVNVRELGARFQSGATVDPDALVAAGLVRNTRRDVKILGAGELTVTLTVQAHAFSKSAREKIEAAGGTVEWLRGEPVPKPKKRRGRGAASAPEPAEAEAETAAEAPVEAAADEPPPEE